VRGIRIGSRAHFEDMVQAIEASKIVPVVDDRVFDFTELKAGYQYLEDQNHFGKVCIRIE
jgi:NADPH:quinone reductase-like Zn-dependent oxidoreductase